MFRIKILQSGLGCGKTAELVLVALGHRPAHQAAVAVVVGVFVGFRYRHCDTARLAYIVSCPWPPTLSGELSD